VAAHVQHGRNSALDHRFDRRAIVEQRSLVAKPSPAIGHVVREQDVQALEHADDGRNARELILRKRLLPLSGRHAVPGAGGDAEQGRGLVPAQVPMCRNPLHRLDGDGAQPRAISFAGKSIVKTGTWLFLEAEARFWNLHHMVPNIAPNDHIRKSALKVQTNAGSRH
jgi:hypothetical protein